VRSARAVGAIVRYLAGARVEPVGLDGGPGAASIHGRHVDRHRQLRREEHHGERGVAGEGALASGVEVRVAVPGRHQRAVSRRSELPPRAIVVEQLYDVGEARVPGAAEGGAPASVVVAAVPERVVAAEMPDRSAEDRAIGVLPDITGLVLVVGFDEEGRLRRRMVVLVVDERPNGAVGVAVVDLEAGLGKHARPRPRILIGPPVRPVEHRDGRGRDDAVFNRPYSRCVVGRVGISTVDPDEVPEPTVARSDELAEVRRVR